MNLNSSDIFFGLVVFVIVLIIGLIVALPAAGVLQCSSDVTDQYIMPDELSGCRIYRMVPAGYGQTLYAISRGGEPVAVEFSHGGKQAMRTAVVMP